MSPFPTSSTSRPTAAPRATLHAWPDRRRGRWIVALPDPDPAARPPLLLVLYDDLRPLRASDVVLAAGEALPDRPLFGAPAFRIRARLPATARPATDLAPEVAARVAAAIGTPAGTVDVATAGRPEFAVAAAADLAEIRSGLCVGLAGGPGSARRGVRLALAAAAVAGLCAGVGVLWRGSPSPASPTPGSPSQVRASASTSVLVPRPPPVAGSPDGPVEAAARALLAEWRSMAPGLPAPTDLDLTDRSLADFAARALALAEGATAAQAGALRSGAADAQAWRARLAAWYRLDEARADALLDEGETWLRRGASSGDVNAEILLVQARVGVRMLFAEDPRADGAIDALLERLWPLKVSWGAIERQSIPGTFSVEADYFNTRGAIEHQRYRDRKEPAALDRAERFFSAALALRSVHGESVSVGVAWAEHNLGAVALDRGDVDRARERLHRALDTYRRLGMPCAATLTALAIVDLLDGRLADARPRLDEALAAAGRNASPPALLAIRLPYVTLARLAGDPDLEEAQRREVQVLLARDVPSAPLRHLRDQVEARLLSIGPATSRVPGAVPLPTDGGATPSPSIAAATGAAATGAAATGAAATGAAATGADLRPVLLPVLLP